MRVNDLTKNKPLMVALLVATVAVAYFASTQMQAVFSISRVNLEQRGVDGPDGELKGGFWRAVMTSGETSENLLMLQLNHTLAKELGSGPNDYPADVLIRGQLDFQISQPFNPYWYVQVQKVEDIVVYPQVSGSHGSIRDTTHTVPEKKVSIWRTGNAELIVPFSVKAVKSFGENAQKLITDDIRATERGEYWDFAFSYESLVTTSQPKKIMFYNPSDRSENFTITLHFTVGPGFDWGSRTMLFVTNLDGTTINNNVFQNDLNTMRQLLSYGIDDDWAFHNYWFGGKIFTSTMYTSVNGNPVKYPSKLGFANFGDGSPSPLSPPIMALPPYSMPFIWVTAEGFSYPTSQTNGIYEYPGWFAPDPADYETRVSGFSNFGSDWATYRSPFRTEVFDSDSSTNPVSHSITSWLADTATRTPSGTLKAKIVPREELNVWGQGAYGTTSAGLGVKIPKSARVWFITLDVSTELIDTFVVQQNFIDVSITQFNVDRTVVGAGETAYLTATLKNNSPYEGNVGYGVTIPSELQGTAVVTGGQGFERFLAGESKTVNIQIKNIGNLVADKTVNLAFTVVNEQPRETARREFQLTFRAGLGIPDTITKVTCYKGDSELRLQGITVTIDYGQAFEFQDVSSTNELGMVTRIFSGHEKYIGPATITVSSDYYKTQSQDTTLRNGENSYMFRLVAKTEADAINDWMIWLLLFASVMVAAPIIAYALIKKKKG